VILAALHSGGVARRMTKKPTPTDPLPLMPSSLAGRVLVTSRMPKQSSVRAPTESDRPQGRS